MLDKRDILQAVAAIKPHLGRIMMADDASKMETELEHLLMKISSEENIEELILSCLNTNDEIQQWLHFTFQEKDGNQESLSKDNPESTGLSDSFAGLAGEPRPIQAPKYVCNYFNCGFEFYLYKAGMRVPDCLIHKVPLNRAND